MTDETQRPEGSRISGTSGTEAVPPQAEVRDGSAVTPTSAPESEARAVTDDAGTDARADARIGDRAEQRERNAAEERLAKQARRTQRRIASRSRTSVFGQFMAVARRRGLKQTCLIEPDLNEIKYLDTIRGAFAIGSAIRRRTARGENVAVLLPTSAGGMIAFFALQAYGRVPTMLNFSAGLKNLRSALRTAEVKIILTSRKFIDLADLEDMARDLGAHAQVVYLEDLREGLTKRDKVMAVVGPKFPWLVRRPISADQPAVVLFTSGTEGEPKGVVLSHQNLVANVEQINDHVELYPDDIMFNSLPIFHSYGLTAGTLFPLLSGKKLVVYPSPLHIKIVPELIRKTSATIMFATDTFLLRYLKSARDGALASLRYAVAGGEHVRDETRLLARNKFGFHVIEGYGMTEASPVVAANQPGDIRPGTVGKLLPGIETRLEPVEGLDRGGRLFVRGPNVMSGYLFADAPGELVSLHEGWHDTGDVVEIDGGGYMSIRGRVKRFAKVCGEMISLAVVENCASVVWPDCVHAAVTLPDDRKGEQIVLLTECPSPDRAALLSWTQSHGVPEIAMPRKIFAVAEMPVLGSGKVDYHALTQIAQERLEPRDEMREAAE